MSEQEKFHRTAARYPHARQFPVLRPHWTRRRFFEIAGAGLTGSFLAGRPARADGGKGSGVTPKNTAQNVIFILLAGAPSHLDTFDLKMIDGTTPASFAPETINGTLWPTGLMPKLANQLSDFAIVRSMRSHALVHTFAQHWAEIGRNPAAPFATIAPHIGSIVAIEKEADRQPGQNYPTFLALNSDRASEQGYLATRYGPVKLTPDNIGISNTISPVGGAHFFRRWDFLHALDRDLRTESPNGGGMADYDDYDNGARALMYDSAQAFSFTSADSARYGGNGFGNACLVAAQVLKARQGTRFIQITSDAAWDMHFNIYSLLPAKAKVLDNAFSALLNDLKASGLLSSTLIVMAGEFGRTPGPLTSPLGRDHYLQQFAVFAGGGVRGGTVIGATDAIGSDTVDYGWSRERYVYTEDVEATIYSALGIDWTYIRPDDPLHRGFEYTPFSRDDLYGPIHELWG